MLIVCGTVSDSIFIASLQPGSQNSLPGFLMMIARDPVPRHLTCMTVIDETTFAVADRFGTVAFLRLPSNIRTGFAEPIDKLTEAELNVVIQDFAARQQFLEEIAVHHPGELVTSMQTLEYNPSGGEDPTLNTRVVFYGTALGSVGCYTPFVDEEDGALSAYLRPLLRQHMRVLLQPCTGQLPFYYHQNRGRGHHVVEGEWLEIYRQSPSAAFPADVKEEVEEALERVKRVEAARRSRLGLPPRVLPSVEDLVAKQRALATLPL